MSKEVDVLGYLQSRFPVIRRGNAYNIHTHCCFHQEDQSKRGRLYINVDPRAEIPGLFHCKVCDERGSLHKLKQFFGDLEDDDTTDLDTEKRAAILEAATKYYYKALAERQDAVDWLVARGLTMDTIVEARLGYAGGGLKSHLRGLGYTTAEIVATGLLSDNSETGKIDDALRYHITIPYMVTGNVVMIRGRQFPDQGDGQKYKTPFGQKSRLYNSDATWDTKEIYVTEGEFDALLLGQNGLAAVASPGADTWQSTWDGYFSDMKRIFVCFDPDEAGDKGAAKMRERLGVRVKVVELPRGVAGSDGADLTDYLRANGIDDFLALVKEAGGSGLLFTVAECAEEERSLANQRGLQFNMTNLDLYLKPGLLRGQVTVLLAKTGVGKTQFTLNLFQRMAMLEGQENLNFLLLSLEQAKWEYWRNAKKIHRFYNPTCTLQEAEDFWNQRMLIVEENRLSEDQLYAVLDDYEYRMGKPPDLVALDYLGYWANGFRGDRTSRVADAINSLKAIAKDRRLPIFTPHQVGRNTPAGEKPDLNSARDSSVVEDTADHLMVMWEPLPQPDALPSKQPVPGQVDIWIEKSRHGGAKNGVNFLRAPLSLVLLPSELHEMADEERMRVIDERRWRETELGITWDEATARHEKAALKNAPHRADEQDPWD